MLKEDIHKKLKLCLKVTTECEKWKHGMYYFLKFYTANKKTRRKSEMYLNTQNLISLIQKPGNVKRFP